MKKYTKKITKNGTAVLYDGIRITIDQIVTTLNDRERLAEQMEQLREALIVDKGSLWSEMLRSAIHFRMKAENVELDSQIREIADKIDGLKMLVDDIKTDA